MHLQLLLQVWVISIVVLFMPRVAVPHAVVAGQLYYLANPTRLPRTTHALVQVLVFIGVATAAAVGPNSTWVDLIAWFLIATPNTTRLYSETLALLACGALVTGSAYVALVGSLASRIALTVWTPLLHVLIHTAAVRILLTKKERGLNTNRFQSARLKLQHPHKSVLLKRIAETRRPFTSTPHWINRTLQFVFMLTPLAAQEEGVCVAACLYCAVGMRFMRHSKVVNEFFDVPLPTTYGYASSLLVMLVTQRTQPVSGMSFISRLPLLAVYHVVADAHFPTPVSSRPLVTMAQGISDLANVALALAAAEQ
jgi:hypothetical protein